MKQPQVLSKLVCLVLFFTPVLAFAQEPPPPNPEQSRGPEFGLPIDANIYILILAGIVIGVYALLKYRPLSGKPE